MAKFRVGIIGHTGRGNYGHGIDTVWANFKDRCEVVAVADADEKGRAEAVKRVEAPKAYADYRQMLDEAKPQIVAVCPRWVDQHRDMVVAAAQRGMHIYTEKPLCRSLAEADEMIAACEKHDVKLAIAHQTRFSPRLQMVREIIDSGQLGTLLELRGRGKEDQRGGGEDLWVLGSHVMNLINFCGGQPKWCFARMEQGGKPVTKEHVKAGNEGLGPLAGDHIVATYGLDSGVTAYFGSKRAMSTGDGRFGLQIYGSKGVLEVLTSTTQLPSVQFLPDPLWSPGRSSAKWIPVTTARIGKPEPLSNTPGSGNVVAVKDLLSAIDNDRQPECNIYEARVTIEMISAVFESHRLGAPVTFPLKTRENPLSLL